MFYWGLLYKPFVLPLVPHYFKYCIYMSLCICILYVEKKWNEKKWNDRVGTVVKGNQPSVADWPVGHLGNARWAGAKIAKMGRHGEMKKREGGGGGRERERKWAKAVEKNSCFHPKIISNQFPFSSEWKLILLPPPPPPPPLSPTRISIDFVNVGVLSVYSVCL